MAAEKNFAKIRGRMAEKNISQDKLAKALGVSTVTLNRKLAGQKDFRLKEVQIIAELLELEDVRPYFFGQ